MSTDDEYDGPPPPDIVCSNHAADVMRRRDVSWGEVLDVISSPEVSFRTLKFGDPRDVYQRGKLTVVVGLRPTGRKVVVTVLLRESEQWTDADARSRRDDR